MINFKKMLLRIKTRIGNIRLKQTAINTAVVAVVILLALYLAVQVSRNISGSVSTLRAQRITDTESLTVKGYIFRDEKIYYSNGGVADFLVDNGERVGVGKQVADIYSVSSGADAQKLQAELDSLAQRIRMLESGISEAKKLSQASQIFDEIDDSYYAMLSAIENGSLSTADKQAQTFLDAVNSYMIATGRTEEAQSVLNSLKEQKAELIARNLSLNTRVEMQESCYFYTQCDGYEGLFDYTALDGLTPASFAGLMSSQKQEYTGAIGKQVFSPVWYICFPVSDEYCDMFENNAANAKTEYEASFLSNDGEKVMLTFESASYSDADGNSGFVKFSCKQMPEDFEFLRAQNVQIDLDSTTGYRVPAEAVHTEDQSNYVYILNGNMVEKRRITVIGKGEGYYIVNTYEADYNETGAVNPVPYLAENELIITSGRDLYDGKLLH